MGEAMSRTLWKDSFKIFVLSAAIKYWMHLYYKGTPVISDNTFDLAYRELQRLERQAGSVAHDSPTKTPGGLIKDD